MTNLLLALALHLGLTVPAERTDKYELMVTGELWAAQPKAGESPVLQLVWIKEPPRNRLPLIYADNLPNEVQANLGCSVGKRGDLRSCEIQEIQPDLPTTRKLALDIVKGHVADPRQIASRSGNIGEVKLYLRAVNRHGQKGPLVCLPPYCKVTPPPPSPPAKK
jgi:hypothetical protein